MKESCKALGSLELKLPSWSYPPFYAKQRTLSLEGKMDIRFIAPSSQPVQPLANLQNSLPSRLRDNYSEQPWRRTGPLKTVTFHIHAYICFLIS